MMLLLRLLPLCCLSMYLGTAAARLAAADSFSQAAPPVAQSPATISPAASSEVIAAEATSPNGEAPLLLPPGVTEEVPARGAPTEEADAPADPASTPPSPGGVIDIRQPESTGESLERAIKSSVEPSWLDDVVDENEALWRESAGVLEIIPNGSGFGLTTLGFKSLWKSESAPGVWVVPRFGWTFASGPSTPAVQAQLYDLRLEMNVAQPINDVWTVHLQLAPAFVSDWNNKSSDAFRLIGGGMLAAHVNAEWTVIGGALALSRFDLPVLPLGGVRWHPQEWLEIDALFPNPRLAWRYQSGTAASHWFYVGGQMGGNQWAIDHATSDHDKLGYRDYRVVIGYETRLRDGNRSLFEIGYVFDRRLHFQRTAGDQQPGETVILRWGGRF